jgi:hypothetical protein
VTFRPTFTPLEGETVFRDRLRTQDDLRRLERWYQTKGYNDGLRNKPAASTNVVYQVAWKRGQERRRAVSDGAA